MRMVVMCLLCAACSNANRPRQMDPDPDLGPGGLPNMVIDGSTAPRDGGTTIAQPDLLEVYKISCGAATCDLTSDQICCFAAGSTTPACTDANGCAFFGHALKCDGSEDCAGTKTCCGTIDPYTSGWCVPGQICPGSMLRLCRASSQCPASAAHCCAPSSALAYACTDNPPPSYKCLK